MVRTLTLIAVIIGSATLTIAFYVPGVQAATIVSLVIGGLWLIFAWFRQHWFAMIGFPVMSILALLAASQEYNAPLSAVAITAGLTAWDLSRFATRLRPALQDANWRLPARRHVRRLLIVNGIGLILAIVAMMLQFRGSFYLEWFIAFVGIFALFLVIILTARFTH